MVICGALNTKNDVSPEPDQLQLQPVNEQDYRFSVQVRLRVTFVDLGDHRCGKQRPNFLNVGTRQEVAEFFKNLK